MKPLLLAYVFARALDLGTTYVAIDRYGAYEANPILPQKPVANLLVGAGLTAGAVYILNKVHKRRPRTAIWLTVGGTAIETLVATHNFVQVLR